MLISVNMLFNGKLREKGHILRDGSVTVKRILAKFNVIRPGYCTIDLILKILVFMKIHVP
jgi:hypothetical protein